MYNGCGQSKNCLSYPENCLSSKSCDGVVAVTGGSRAYEIEMFAKQGKYVAVGFSDDENMVRTTAKASTRSISSPVAIPHSVVSDSRVAISYSNALTKETLSELISRGTNPSEEIILDSKYALTSVCRLFKI